MRSAIIIASFALTLLAAPVAVPESQAPARQDLTDNSPIETTIDERFSRYPDGTLGARDVSEQEAEVERRANTVGVPRSEDDEDEVEKRGRTRLGHPRSEDDEEVEVEKRGNRIGVPRGGNRIGVPRGGNRIGVPRGGNRIGVPRGGNRIGVPRGGNRIGVPRGGNRIGVPRGGNRIGVPRSEDENEVEIEKRGYVSNQRSAIRSIYDGVVEMVEALKTRGFNSAANLPARQPM